jgi:hypothetical protein
MSRFPIASALLIALLAVAAPAAAQPLPAPTASTSPASSGTDVELRERTARLDEALKARQDDIQRLSDAQAKLKERLDGFWTALLTVLGVLSAALLGAIRFYFPRMTKRIVEEGRHEIVKSVVAELLKEEPARLTKRFAAQRDEIARLILAKDRPLLLLGDAPEKERIRGMLERVGYTQFVDKAFKAGLIVLVGKETCETEAKELLAKKAFARGPKPMVLYTGTARMDDALLAELNQVTLAVTANMPSTAVAHVSALSALTQTLSDTTE